MKIFKLKSRIQLTSLLIFLLRHWYGYFTQGNKSKPYSLKSIILQHL